MHLFLGARHPSSDVFYAPEIGRWLEEGRLASIETAFSRTAARSYVQDALRRDGPRLAALIASGAQVMSAAARTWLQASSRRWPTFWLHSISRLQN